MAQFRILEGKALASAIKGASAKIATFAQLQHELAYGAVLHLDRHNGVEYVQAVYDAMPANYKGAIRTWFTAFGKCTFDSTTKAFTYAKGKKSDMAAALATSPADYERAAKKKGNPVFNEVAALDAFIKRMTENGASARTLRALDGVKKMLAAPAVVEVPAVKPAKAKTAKAAPETAPEAIAA